MTEQFVDITADAPGGTGRRWFAGPPGRLFGAVLAANIALTVVAYAAPGRFLLAWLACAAVWIALGLSAVARIGLAVAQHGWRGSGVGLRWSIVGAVVAVTAVAVLAGVPMRAGLQLAKQDMITFAGNAGAAAPRRVGPYPVERAERLPGGGARFLIAGTGLLDPSGFAYAPAGPPPRIGEDTYRPLGGGWYLWTESW